MIVPDLNLLVFAYNDGAPFHPQARAWWEGLVNGDERVGIPWVVTSGFVRLTTHPRVLAQPMTVSTALGFVRRWFEFPHVTPLNPGARHLEIFQQLVEAAGTGGNLVTDAHIAAVAIEFQGEVQSNDTDFARFPGLNWSNPVSV